MVIYDILHTFYGLLFKYAAYCVNLIDSENEHMTSESTSTELLCSLALAWHIYCE